MSHNALPATQNNQSSQPGLVSSGILILEAAIATLVLSVFAATTPSLLTTHLPTAQPTAAKDTPSLQKQLLSVHLSIVEPTPNN
jgi:hypothetical protein